MEARAPTTTLAVVVDNTGGGGAGRGGGTGVATLEKAEGVLAPSPPPPPPPPVPPLLPVGVEGAETREEALWRRVRKSTPSLHTAQLGAVAEALADWVRCTLRRLRRRRKEEQF